MLTLVYRKYVVEYSVVWVIVPYVYREVSLSTLNEYDFWASGKEEKDSDGAS